MIRLIKWLFILCFLIGVLLGMLVANSVDKQPMLVEPAELTLDEVRRVQYFIKNNPVDVKSGEVVNKQISQRDLNVLLNYLTLKTARGINRQLRVKMLLEQQQAKVLITARLPETPLGEYINVSAKLTENMGSNKASVDIKSLRIGSIPVPEIFTKIFVAIINEKIQASFAEYGLIRDSIKSVSFTKDHLSVDYVWNAKTERSIKTHIGLRILPKKLKRALIAHSNNLTEISYQFPEKPTLNELINAMFQYARIRSERHDPVIENRAAFIALGAYVLKRNVPVILGKKSTKLPRYRWVYLNGRHDLSKHFILSAAITSMADSEIAESMSVEKEVRDAKNGSGFSFTDLAADHAGIRLVQEATRNEEQAKYFQQQLAEAKSEADYMLDVKNLPENIELSSFQKNYEGTESEAYLKIEKTIKKTIDELPIYNKVEIEDE